MKLFGVNVAGADFGEQNLPGVLNKDYIYPADLSEYKYFADKKLTLFRVSFRWERVQHQAMDPLNPIDIDNLRTTLDTIQNVGGKAILDLHNYGRYFNIELKKVDAPKLSDVWTKLANTFKDHPALFGYELMNEPHDLPEGADSWNYLAQHAVDYIRTVDAQSFILIPGYDWQSADRWQTSNPNLHITGHKIIYTAHCYFDNDASGQYQSGAVTDSAVGVMRVSHFIDWLKMNNYEGMITEYGIPWADVSWQPVLENFMRILTTNDCILGGTYWAAGPWWGDYVTTLEPKNGVDRSSMAIVAKYPSITDVQPTPPTPPTPPVVVPSPPAPTTPTPPVTTPQPVAQNKYALTLTELVLTIIAAVAFGIVVSLDVVEVLLR